MVDASKQNKLEHPCFPQVKDQGTKVWRYLDLAKFVWLLENRKLYLSRLDLLNDPHEGSTPRLLAKLRDEQMNQLTGGKSKFDFGAMNRQSRKTIYVNCWHAGHAESEAMWRLYCSGDNGVAIQTTYGKLVQSVDYDPFFYIGCVTYIDYDRGGFPLNNLFYPVMHKRLSFAHESEVRLVKTLAEHWNTPNATPIGLTVDWPIDTVEAIYVNPYAPDYYHDVVRSIVRRIDLKLEEKVLWSHMRGAPVY
jgi:hypothetical protein